MKVNWNYLLPAIGTSAVDIALNVAEFDVKNLPVSFLSNNETVVSITPQSNSNCNQVLLVETTNKKFILKIATGKYRREQLRHEFEIAIEFQNGKVKLPVARPCGFYEKDDVGYFSQEYINGKIVDNLINENQVFELSNLLMSIHKIETEDARYDEVLSYDLQLAEFNLKNKLIDLEEFKDIGNPVDVLLWLNNNRPSPTDNCLLHGDFRPKNVLWNEDKIVSIVDWSFCSIGDRYYDLAIIKYYMDKTEQFQEFINVYGIENLDMRRLDYYEKLSKFINV